MTPSDKTIRVGIAGSGFAARFHYIALRKVHGGNVPGLKVEIVGVWSPNEANRRKFATERKIAELMAHQKNGKK